MSSLIFNDFHIIKQYDVCKILITNIFFPCKLLPSFDMEYKGLYPFYSFIFHDRKHYRNRLRKFHVLFVTITKIK